MNAGEFFFDSQDQTVFELDFLFFVISDKVWWNVSSVESHTIHKLGFVMKSLSFLDCYCTVNTNFLVQVGQKVTDLSVTIGWDCSNIWDCLSASDFGWLGLQVLKHVINSFVDTFLDVSWVQAWFNFLETFLENCSGQNGGSCGTITGFIVGLAGNTLNETGSNVNTLVWEFNGFSDGDTVLGDLWAAITLIDQYISSTWTQGDRNSLGELLATFEEFFSGLSAEK